MSKKWYQIENKGEKAEVWIYEQIGEDFWSGDGVTAKKFQKELAAVKASQIDLHINSPGGSVFDGLTIYNLLKQHPATVTTYIDGLAASIASVIALAGDRVIMADNALFMIHQPSGAVVGTASDMRDFADTLDKVSGAMLTTYTGKTGREEEEITGWLDAETWFSAAEALDYGFIDEVAGQVDMAACAKFVPSLREAGIKKIPAEITGAKETHTAREIERILRDGGVSSGLAKAIVAGGFKDGQQRDVAVVESEQRDVGAVEPEPLSRAAELIRAGEIKFLERK